eukprot:8022903-Pyramimonas_sp.AAC.2
MAAERLDVIQGHAKWKACAQSTIYDWKRLDRKLQHFQDFILHLQTGIHCPNDPSMGYEGAHPHLALPMQCLQSPNPNEPRRSVQQGWTKSRPGFR